MERGTKSQRGGEERREWNGVEPKCSLASEGELYLQGPRFPSYATADWAGPPISPEPV